MSRPKVRAAFDICMWAMPISRLQLRPSPAGRYNDAAPSGPDRP